MITLISPVAGECFSITTEVYKEFARRDYAGEHICSEEDAYRRIGEYYDTKTDGSLPARVRLKWKNSSPDGENRVELRLAGEKSAPASVGMIGNVCYLRDEDTYYADVTNLMSGEEYVWSVDGSEKGHFSTARGELRNIEIPTLSNIRDIGGRINVDGVRIKQGLIYRGVSLNSYGGVTDKERAKGLKVFREQLGVKCDLDLRDEVVGKLTQSPLGLATRFELVPFDAYGATLNDGGRAVLRRAIETMADADNYPLYFHCQAGADRTGTVGAYLDAILGVPDRDIILNYNLTTLSHFDARCWHVDDCGRFHDYLEETYPELSLRERLLTNLRLSGITEETLEKIRDIMLEK